MHKMALFRAVSADLKPYFFIYRYDHIKSKYDKYNKSVASNCKIKFGKSLFDLQNSENLTEEEAIFLENYEKYLPISIAPGVMNRICWKIEDEFQSTDVFQETEFDSSVLKNDLQYTQTEYDAVKNLYDNYNHNMQLVLKNKRKNEESDDNTGLFVDQIKAQFLERCHEVCPNSAVLSNVVIDLCYSSSKNKTFAWDVAGEQIYQNVLSKNSNTISFPVKDNDGDFEFAGEKFVVKQMVIGGGHDDFE